MRGDGVRADHALGAWDQIRSTLREAWDAAKPSSEAAFSGLSLPWSRAERALRFGYSAAQWYGRRNPVWNAVVEAKLAAEWELYRPDNYRWRDIREVVRHGYEFALRA